MKRQALLAIGLVALIFFVAPASAHDEYRVVGTVTYYKGIDIKVGTKDGRTANIHLDENTELYRDNKKIAADELTVGNYVVVDAYGDSYDNMLALEIKIVRPPAN